MPRPDSLDIALLATGLIPVRYVAAVGEVGVEATWWVGRVIAQHKLDAGEAVLAPGFTVADIQPFGDDIDSTGS